MFHVAAALDCVNVKKASSFAIPVADNAITDVEGLPAPACCVKENK